MGRKRRFTLYPIALSPSALSDSIGIPMHRVRDAIATGELKAFQDGQRIRIRVHDAVDWIATWPRAEIRRTRLLNARTSLRDVWSDSTLSIERTHHDEDIPRTS